MKRKQIIRLTESKLRRLIREAIEDADKNHDFMDREAFYEDVVDILNKYIKHWHLDYEYERTLAYNYVEDYADYFVNSSLKSMDKYIHSGDYDMPGNFANIGFDYKRKFEYAEEISLSDMIEMIDNGETNEYTKAFKLWTIDWFWDAFGTFGLTYNFGEFMSDEFSVYESEMEEENNEDNEEDDIEESIYSRNH